MLRHALEYGMWFVMDWRVDIVLCCELCVLWREVFCVVVVMLRIRFSVLRLVCYDLLCVVCFGGYVVWCSGW